jgi:UDP-glucose 4-epimerase
VKKDSVTSDYTLLTPHRWLITGGCGFIGTNLVQNLASKGNHYIRIVDNLSLGTREDLAKVCTFTEKGRIKSKNASLRFSSPHEIHANQEGSGFHQYSNPSLLPQAELIVGDILDEKFARKMTEGIDVVVHLAANTGVGPSIKNPRRDMEVNTIGTFNMLEAARQESVKKFIFASSGAPIGECQPAIHEEMAPHPVSPYGASKLAGEGYCSAYYRTFGIETIVLRFGNVYGPGSAHKDSVVAKFIRQAMHNETLEIYGDGQQTRDFIYIDDLIKAVLLATIRDGIGGQIFQIATFQETTIDEIGYIIKEIVEKETGKKARIIHTNPRPGDVFKNYSDISKAKNMLGYEPEFDLYTGLRKTFKYFKMIK